MGSRYKYTYIHTQQIYIPLGKRLYFCLGFLKIFLCMQMKIFENTSGGFILMSFVSNITGRV